MALIHIGGKSYELVHENRNGWNPEAFRDRYSEVLERYDFIVGDWGYSQLRLKGFFRDSHSKATKDSLYSGMPDYINEYCNFGCAYFILEKKESSKKEPGDYDFDAEELKPRVDARTYRMPESAGRSETGTLDETAAGKEAGAPAQERHERQERPNRGAHRHDNSPREHNQRENGQRDNGHRSGGGSGHPRGEKGEQQPRKPYRGGNDRNKKHSRSGTAAGEAAASAESPANQRPNKDAGRS
ncbi:YutD-like domain-containing protein [Paenibacillus sp. YIM B09110]|uniref:YutD-like domain-containing protein n=1 Tax=Paenibacillus sp. YIM B09110 TaxID=3126102 RepID=UPI00301C448D